MNSKKKLIALVTNNDDDVYCFRKELLEAFTESGYRILISCPYGEKFELLRDLEYIYDDVYIDRRGTNVFADFKLLCHYFGLLKKHRPDIVLTYTAKPNVYCSIAARMLKIPYINNVTGFGSVLKKSGLMQKFILGLFKLAYKNADCIMFQNEANMQLAQQSGMIGKDSVLIPGSGVALDRFPLQPYPDGEPIVFNYIGRILKDKGVDDYIAAAKIIKKKYPGTEFNMLGFIEPTEMHYKDELEELGRQGIVYYRGSQKDIRPFVARSHATIHPSTYGEGMSNVLLESAASGRPLITTDNHGCMETVDDGVSGYIYHGGNVDGLVQCIEKFLSLDNEKRRQMGLCGRQKVAQQFSRQFVIDAYLNKINEIIK
ncbi:MAG: glycosyltransferase family 4 protein [Clostridia bacterium]|nr:glycosyltransferase family 4 protein [Clostridia bacterium]